MSLAPLSSHFQGALLGCALGDAIGYKNGAHEFNSDTLAMHREMRQRDPNNKECIETLDLNGWRVSDDTVMHLATVDALVECGKNHTEGLQNREESQDESQMPPHFTEINAAAEALAKHYILCWRDMSGRAPGGTCGAGVYFLERNGITNWQKYPYSRSGGGCGGSMRAMGIGLRYFAKKSALSQQNYETLRDLLVAVSIESGRMTHNHPTGFLGAMTAAVFTALAVEGEVPLEQWPHVLLNDFIPRAAKYLRACKRDWGKIEGDMEAFVAQWKEYMTDRGMLKADDEMQDDNQDEDDDEDSSSDYDDNNTHRKRPSTGYPANMRTDPKVRDAYYRKFSFNGWYGASGDDSVIVAYDSLLECKDDYDKLVFWSCLNAGDCDSIGAIALTWYGALYGVEKFYDKNLEHLEKRERLEKQAHDLLQMVQQDERMKGMFVE